MGNISIEKNNTHFYCLASLLVKALLLVTIVFIFVPLYPGMPAASLDPSWVFGMNQAVSQSLRMGTDLVFTFGPYSSVYTKAYHPATDAIMLSGSLYLALVCWLSLVFLAKKNSFVLLFVFFVLFSGLMYQRDALLFFLPLLVGLSTFNICSSHNQKSRNGYSIGFFVFIIFSQLGFLPLVKGSLLVLCCVVSILCTTLFLLKKRNVLALISLLSPLCSMFFFWIASGQLGAGLSSYFINMIPIVSGYTEAMAYEGDVREIVVYIASSLLLLLAIFLKSKKDISTQVFLVGIYFVFLFLSFKAGFVRHDGHALVAGASILLAGLSSLFLLNNGFYKILIVPSFIAGFYISSNYAKITPDTLLSSARSTFSLSWSGISNRITLENWPRSAFDNSLELLRTEANFPVLKGTVDIYSYNQSYLIASGNDWTPRPVFQSYSVYTPALAEMNKKYLIGKDSPDNIIFRVEPIDGRMPSTEDGASWPILMTNYHPSHIENNFLFLEKNKKTEEAMMSSSSVMDGKYNFGDIVELPASDQPLFAKIEINQTIIGRLVSILFKPSQLQLTVELGSGIKKQYRIISGMAKSGFIISPLIEDTVDFSMLYADSGILDEKAVKSISISPKGGNSILWKNEYAISLTKVKSEISSDISKIYDFEGFESSVSVGDIVQAEKCDGFIDTVNGITPAPEHIDLNSFIRIDGWLASSVEKGIIPEETYVVFTDSEHNQKFLKVRAVSRGDVGGYFKKPELNMSGYSSLADVSSMHGDYVIGLAMKVSGKIEICPQFKIKATINKDLR
ncbi:hypothetical protein GIV63_03440 [Pseudomonas sp. PA-3-10C]|nr:hypothetical protein [Pseudomonas sp. PA-3-5D]MCF5592134.1 hypothetical protein [Pseudomonas sp. PA-3-10C]